ncbi:acyltransferase [Oleidesulfovibrio sp.]|uniref:acyltransferase n=1 Tax=Oleidesulfovibrio sp. TaxID=2909707 RepID=UPI003A8A9CDC
MTSFNENNAAHPPVQEGTPSEQKSGGGTGCREGVMHGLDGSNRIADEPIRFQSRVRSAQSENVWHNIRRWWLLRGVGHAGSGIHMDAGVHLMRYKANMTFGERVFFKEGARVCAAQPDAVVHIGRNTTIGYHTYIFASSGITIGNDCLIAPFCYLVDADHGIAAGKNINTQDMSARPIVIGDDVWLGARVTVLSGVHIGNGAVAGAGSVINADVPDNVIVAGSPARIVGYRK